MKLRVTVALALFVYLVMTMGMNFHSHTLGGQDQFGLNCKLCQASQTSAECPDAMEFWATPVSGFASSAQQPVDFSTGISFSLLGRAPPLA